MIKAIFYKEWIKMRCFYPLSALFLFGATAYALLRVQRVITFKGAAHVWEVMLAGLTLYLLTAWICLEPTWKRRLANLLIAVGVCRIFFLSDTPQAYDGMLPWLALLLVCSLFFPLLSVYRFKQGCQD